MYFIYYKYREYHTEEEHKLILTTMSNETGMPSLREYRQRCYPLWYTAREKVQCFAWYISRQGGYFTLVTT